MKLIDKDALIAEIERRLRELSQLEKASYEIGLYDAYKIVLSFIDTIEVKEVDLDKETTHYLLYEHHSPLNEIMHKADLKSEMQYHKDVENAFKAGFELGLKAQKEE